MNRKLSLTVTEDEAAVVGRWMQSEEPMSLLDAIQRVFQLGVEVAKQAPEPEWWAEPTFRMGWNHGAEREGV